eukprot:scaffold74423_cov27-Tisochrysis_lutea.AAC.4
MLVMERAREARADAREHQRVRIAAERVLHRKTSSAPVSEGVCSGGQLARLQKPGQFGFPIRDMPMPTGAGWWTPPFHGPIGRRAQHSCRPAS